MTRPTVTEIECKSLLNRVHTPTMPFNWSINPYRGCSHACAYCYARRYNEYLDLGPGTDFETQIFAKVNAPQVLRRELARRGWKQDWVAIGTAVDPYQPAEGKYKLTRGILQALHEYWTPCSLVTKNSMVLRDLDILQELARGPGCSVCFSITTVDEGLASRIEPDVPPVSKRLQVMQRLVEGGISAGVMLAPILPGLTDDRTSLEAVVHAAKAHEACFLHTGVLRLEGSVKQVFKDFLLDEAPSLLPLYRDLYPGPYAPPQYQDMVMGQVKGLKCTYRLDKRGSDRSPNTPRQATILAPAEPRTAKPFLQMGFAFPETQ